MSRRLLPLLLAGALLAGCVDEGHIANMPGVRCHSDLNFAFCLVPLHGEHPTEAVVTGSTVLSAFGAGASDIMGGFSAHAALTK